MDVEQVVEIALAAVVGLATLFLAWRANRLAKLQAAQYLRDCARTWGDEVVNVLQKAITGRFTSLTRKQASEIAGEVSALIDRGRFHFENDREKGYGQWKARGYQGLAPAAIQLVKDAHDALVSAANAPDDAIDLVMLHDELVGIRRDFVSELQAYIEPGKMIRDLRG